jgi:DNA polymerase-1
MTYAVLDLETTSKQSFKRVANPFDADNRIVLEGILFPGKQITIWDKASLNFVSLREKLTTLVGHNIKFDLLYLWDYPRLQEWIANGGKIFDTMVAQYILDAQKPESLALEVLAPTYGGTKKTAISKLIKAGRCPGELYKKYPKALRRYLCGDLSNTEIVMLKQLQLLNKEGQLNLTKALMDSVLATTEMEFNGIYVNREVHKELKTNKIYEIADKLAELEKQVNTIWSCKAIKFNPASNDHVSLLFFGGQTKYKERQPIWDASNSQPQRIKTGKNAGLIKYKNVELNYTFMQIIEPGKITKPVKKLGFYQVNDAVISKIATKRGNVGNIARLLLDYRAATKELNTYYEGFEECIQPDNCIHGSLNQCVTDTGRLASSKPNLQNMPRKGTSQFKKIFTSRFGDDGVLIEADFKQLEVVGAAFLSNDPVMKAEITSGVDMHLLNAEWVYSKPKEEVTDDERTRVKQQTFQLLYGASAYALSLSVGCTKDEAQAFIDGFYAKYKGVAAWHKKLEMDVYKNAVFSPDGRRTSIYKNVSGRKLKFKEVIRKSGNVEFNLPDIKNYPVQSFATGDIVPIQIGKLYRALLPYRDKVKLINTVHDSVLLDCEKKFARETCKIIKDVLEYSRWMMDLWNIDFDLPLKVDISIGNSWYDLVKASNYFNLNSD